MWDNRRDLSVDSWVLNGVRLNSLNRVSTGKRGKSCIPAQTLLPLDTCRFSFTSDFQYSKDAVYHFYNYTIQYIQLADEKNSMVCRISTFVYSLF